MNGRQKGFLDVATTTHKSLFGSRKRENYRKCKCTHKKFDIDWMNFFNESAWYLWEKKQWWPRGLSSGSLHLIQVHEFPTWVTLIILWSYLYLHVARAWKHCQCHNCSIKDIHNVLIMLTFAFFKKTTTIKLMVLSLNASANHVSSVPMYTSTMKDDPSHYLS